MRHSILLLAFLSAFLVCAVLPTPSTAARLRVALLLESDAPDLGAADLLRKGLEEACQETGAEGEVVVAGPDTDQVALFRKAAAAHDLVIVAEMRLHQILRNNAGNFPKVMFGCIDTGVRARNIMSVTFEDEPAFFLAGAAASLLAPKGTKLGWLESEDTPPLASMREAFSAGAALSGKEDTLLIRRCGFNEAIGAADGLRALARNGAGIVVVAAGYAGRGAYNAAASAGVQIIGMDQDQTAEAPRFVALSIVKDYRRAIREIVRSAASGSFRAKEIVEYTLADKGVAIVFNPAFIKNGKVSAHVEHRLEELRREIAAGNIAIRNKRIPTLCQSCLD